MRWLKGRMTTERCTGLQLCILKNQIVIMEALKKTLEVSYPHTSRYGSDYTDMIQSRIDACGKIIEL